MAKTAKAFGKRQKKIEPAVRKSAKFKRLPSKTKKQILEDAENGVSYCSFTENIEDVMSFHSCLNSDG